MIKTAVGMLGALLLCICSPCVYLTAAEKSQGQGQGIAYYIEKLGDKEFTEKYGHGYTWYTAAEELGLIGLQAIPELMTQLTSDDPFRVSLALYALMLASQDKTVLALTDNSYVQLDEVLKEEANEANVAIAMAWWKLHGRAISHSIDAPATTNDGP